MMPRTINRLSNEQLIERVLDVTENIKTHLDSKDYQNTYAELMKALYALNILKKEQEKQCKLHLHNLKAQWNRC